MGLRPVGGIHQGGCVNYHFADGWSVGSSPEITANWIASGGKWTVPVGGGFGKAFHLAGQAMKLDFNAFYNAIRPKPGNDSGCCRSS